MSNKQKVCTVCHKKFSITDLFPNALLRDNLFKHIVSKLPEFSREGYVCYPDYRHFNAKHYEEVLQKEKGELSKLEKEVIESLREHEFVSENANEQFEEALSFGERISDKLASFGGSWTFIIGFIVVLVSWISINISQMIANPFDPFPFILLNLVLSTIAAIQAPVILMSQNRQASKDRLKSDQDYIVNLKAELQIRQLNSRFDIFMKHHWQIMNEVLELLEETQKQVEIREAIKNK